MRLMFTTALASAALFAGPALAAGDKVQGAAGMTAPEASAAQLPGQSADHGRIQQDLQGAGFSDVQSADDAQIFRAQTGDGQPVWVVLMPQDFQIGSVGMGEPGIGAQETVTLDQDRLPDVSQQAEAGDQPQRGEQADVAETLDGAQPGEQAEVAEAPDLGAAGEQPDIAEAPEAGQPGEQPDMAERLDRPGAGEQPDIAGSPDLPGERPDVAEAPGVGEPGIAGETQPEGFAAQIPGELRSDLEGAGFQQIESVDGASIFHAKTGDGQTAFVIVGDLGGAGLGFDQQPAPGLGQQQPGAAPGMPETAPGAAPQPTPGLPQQ